MICGKWMEVRKGSTEISKKKADLIFLGRDLYFSSTDLETEIVVQLLVRTDFLCF